VRGGGALALPPLDVADVLTVRGIPVEHIISYSTQGGLDLRTQQISYEENPWTGISVTRTTTYDTSDAISYFAWGDNVDEWDVHGFTDETVTSISAVPEPHALFGAGLLLLGAATRRRERR
jgi:hypothetical protein